MADYINTSQYWANSYWGGSYWGVITTVAFDFAEHYDVNVIMNTTLNFSQVLNTTIAFTGLMNRTLDFDYEELDEL